MRIATYEWQHTPTGTKGTCEFTYTHFREVANLTPAANSIEGNEAFPLPADLAHKLVNRWNAQPFWKFRVI